MLVDDLFLAKGFSTEKLKVFKLLIACWKVFKDRQPMAIYFWRFLIVLILNSFDLEVEKAATLLCSRLSTFTFQVFLAAIFVAAFSEIYSRTWEIYSHDVTAYLYLPATENISLPFPEQFCFLPEIFQLDDKLSRGITNCRHLGKQSTQKAVKRLIIKIVIPTLKNVLRWWWQS